MWIRIYAMFLFPPNLVPLSEGSCPRSGLRGVPSCCRTRLQLLELGNTSQIRQFIRNPNELHQYPQPHPATPRMGCRPTAHPVSPRPGHVWHDCWPQPRVGHRDHVPRARHPHLSAAALPFPMRAMQRIQVLQPQIQRIQHKYAARKDPRSKEAMQREIMALQQRYNANPLGSCLPSLIQAPILCSLFYTLQSLPAIADGNAEPLGGIDHTMAGDIESSSIFGVRIATRSARLPRRSHASSSRGRGVDVPDVVRDPVDAHSPQYVERCYGLAAIPCAEDDRVRLSRHLRGVGCTLPFGVLLYWLTNNLWNLGQTLCQLRWFPTPGSAEGRAQGQARLRAGQPSPCRSRSAIPRGGACDGRPRGGESPTRARKVGRQPQPQTTQNPHLAKRSIVKR